MKKFYFIILIFILNLSFSLTPNEALKILENSSKTKKSEVPIKTSVNVATMLVCSDMNTEINNIFKLKKENIYTVKVLGNVALEPEIASLEYSAVQLQSPLIVVMGHYSCNIIDDVLKDKIKENDIYSIVQSLKGATEKAQLIYGSNYSEMLYKQSVVLNVYNVIEEILKTSKIIKDLINLNKIKIVGAIYNERKNSIEWLGEHPMQREIMEGSFNSLEFLAFYKDKQSSKKVVINHTSTINKTPSTVNKTKNLTQAVVSTSTPPKIKKTMKTEVNFITDKITASPRKPSYITVRIETFKNAKNVDLSVYAENIATRKREIIFKLPDLRIVDGLGQAQFYFAGRKFGKNLYLPKGSYRIIANIKVFSDNKSLIENKLFQMDNIINLY